VSAKPLAARTGSAKRTVDDTYGQIASSIAIGDATVVGGNAVVGTELEVVDAWLGVDVVDEVDVVVDLEVVVVVAAGDDLPHPTQIKATPRMEPTRSRCWDNIRPA
jgi:hypothetical protein